MELSWWIQAPHEDVFEESFVPMLCPALLSGYVTHHPEDCFSFTREQASAFARERARDFNPLHDPDSTRFCVPGDLLFASVCAWDGLSEHMDMRLEGMVDDKALLALSGDRGSRSLTDVRDHRVYAKIENDGASVQDPALVYALVQAAVTFTGQHFFSTLIPRMREYGVMVHPTRPLVVYDRIRLDLDDTQMHTPEIRSAGSDMHIEGRRGTLTLKFEFHEQGRTVGSGYKTMQLRGLRKFDSEAVEVLVNAYRLRQDSCAA